MPSSTQLPHTSYAVAHLSHSGQRACVCSLVWISIARSSHMMAASSVRAAVGSFHGKCETGMTKQATGSVQSSFELISVPSNSARRVTARLNKALCSYLRRGKRQRQVLELFLFVWYYVSLLNGVSVNILAPNRLAAARHCLVLWCGTCAK